MTVQINPPDPTNAPTGATPGAGPRRMMVLGRGLTRLEIILWLVAFGLGAFFLPLYLIATTVRQDVQARESELNSVRTSLTTVPTVAPEVQNLVNTLGQIQGQLNQVNAVYPTIVAGRSNWPALMGAVANYNADQVYLTALQRSDTTRITINGRAASEALAVAYTRSLEQTGLFQSVVLQSIQTIPTAQPTLTPRPGPTITPTATLSPTITLTPTPDQRDLYEPDDTQAKPIYLGQGQTHTFYPVFDVDNVSFLAKNGRYYHVFTSDLAPGVDTFLTVRVGQLVYSNDDAFVGTLASDITFRNDGPDTVAVVTITNRAQYGPDKNYTITVEEIVPTATPTPTLTGTPVPTNTPTPTNTPDVTGTAAAAGTSTAAASATSFAATATASVVFQTATAAASATSFAATATASVVYQTATAAASATSSAATATASVVYQTATAAASATHVAATATASAVAATATSAAATATSAAATATTLASTNLHGVVTNSRFGYALSGAAVNLVGPVSRTNTTGSTGAYAFNSIPPGVYNESAARSGYQDYLPSSVTVAPGANTRDFAMTPCVGITSKSLAPATQTRGLPSTLSYQLTNACSSSMNVWLGGQIKLGVNSYVDAAHDVSVTALSLTTVAVTRTFTIPAGAPAGTYDVEWTVWESRVGSNLAGKFDGQSSSAVLTVTTSGPSAFAAPGTLPLAWIVAADPNVRLNLLGEQIVNGYLVDIDNRALLDTMTVEFVIVIELKPPTP